MKVLTILLFLVITATSALSQTGWFRLNSGIKTPLIDVAFADSITGIAISDYPSTALRTYDGGINWNTIQFPDSMSPGYWHIQRVLFTTDNSGYILIRNVEPMWSIDTAIYHLYKTTDKGLTWSEKNPTPHDDSRISFVDIVFPTPNTGYILGDISMGMVIIYKTTNGGETWSKISCPIGYNEDITPYITFRDSLQGIIVVKSRSIYNNNDITYAYTPDGGNTWKRFPQPSSPEYNDWDRRKYFGYSKKNRWLYIGKDSSKIIINDNLLDSSQWKATPGFFHYHHSICWGKFEFFDPEIGYVAQLRPDPNINKYPGNIYKTSDGGTSWIIQETNTLSEIYAVSAPTKNIAYGVGDSGTIIKTIDGGGPKSSVLTDKSENGGLSLWPNPASTTITVAPKGVEHLKTISILNTLGEEVIRKYIPVNSSTIEIDLNELQPGAYTVIAGGNSRKIIKQ